MPIKPNAVKVPLVKSKPVLGIPKIPPKTLTPLKTGVERPVLRAFECLVNVEQAKHHIDQVGLFVGESSEEIRVLRNRLAEDVEQLRGLYRQYWNLVSIEHEGNQ